MFEFLTNRLETLFEKASSQSIYYTYNEIADPLRDGD